MDTGSERMVAMTEGAIGWMIFNHPARHNAVSMAMWQGVVRIIEAFKADPAVRAIIVTGAGERAFVSGADISEFDEKRATPAAIAEYDAVGEHASQLLETVAKPTIAMIRGYCIGGGVDLALRCDIRIASDDARFGVPAAKLGLGYPFSDVNRLVGVVGPAFAKEIFYSGRQFTATEARQMGLVNRVVPAGEIEGSVRALADTIVGNAPLSIAATKRCVGEALKDADRRDMAACQAAVDACYASADYVEGRTAFMEKRRPVFRAC
jgi:enoyl-CoA hydratase/carnithine racemase